MNNDAHIVILIDTEVIKVMVKLSLKSLTELKIFHCLFSSYQKLPHFYLNLLFFYNLCELKNNVNGVS